jgi:hypothetical protein
MWIANFLFGALALVLLARMGMESGSSRGGDFSEILDTMRHKFRRKPARPARVMVPRSIES